METETTKEPEAILKLLIRAEEKREEYPSLYLTLNFQSPARTAIGQA